MTKDYKVKNNKFPKSTNNSVVDVQSTLTKATLANGGGPIHDCTCRVFKKWKALKRGSQQRMNIP